jgi:hypothetical protein
MQGIWQLTKQEVQGKLLIQGLTFKDFAEKIHEEPGTVRKVITRHCCGTERRPRGKKTKEILRKLEEQIAANG